MENQRTIKELPGNVLAALFGKFDENVKIIENTFGVRIVGRGGDIIVAGDSSAVERACSVFDKLAELAVAGDEINEQKVNYVIDSLDDGDFENIGEIGGDSICLTVTGRPIKPKTLGQKKYVDRMRRDTIVFGTGPAGTGKTYLAMAMAVTAFKRNEASRIILTRPAIEAGEKLGFLPGDLQQKVDPYLRPLFDALHEMMGAETFQKNVEKGLIEVAPLAYMRGRTLDNAYIVLDEAQNTTPEQMKMFLTRLGFGSKAVITGDLTQIDLPDSKRSGLTEAVRVLEGIEGIGICALTNKDVVRHPLVQKIVKAYEKHESSKRTALRAKYKVRSAARSASTKY